MFPTLPIEKAIDLIAREEWGYILSSLVGSLNNIQLAEDCLQDALISALDHWQKNGIPNSPSAWLITVARRKAIDLIRRDKNFEQKQSELAYLIKLENQEMAEEDMSNISDKRLEMIFTCCHPALEEKTQIALTLRTIGGLTTEEIASAFLDRKDAMAQRLVRAKTKISKSNIPYKIPELEELPERVKSVLSVIYLIFNEGYSSSSNSSLMNTDLSNEAIRLARIVQKLMPEETEIAGLLALMLMHDSRRTARIDANGLMVPLEKQNRRKWDKGKIAEGNSILQKILPKQKIGPYQIQAAISAIHAQTPNWEETDWQQISAFYKMLFAMQPTSIVKLNLAVAISYAQSPQAALNILKEFTATNELENYQPFHATMGDLLHRSHKKKEAKLSYQKAIDLTKNQLEKSFLLDKLKQLS